VRSHLAFLLGNIAVLKRGLKLLYSSRQFLQDMEELAVLPDEDEIET
jgi:hypothetical protein